jgi:hypothetical protein
MLSDGPVDLAFSEPESFFSGPESLGHWPSFAAKVIFLGHPSRQCERVLAANITLSAVVLIITLTV